MMTDQFNFDNPIIPGSIWDKNADYKIPVVSPVGNGPKGDKGDPAYFDDLTEEQLQKIYQEASFVGNKSEDAVVTTTGSSTTTIAIPFDDYDQFDMLFIDVNGLDLSEHDDYEISGTTVILTTPLPAGQDVHFRLLRYDVIDGDKNIVNTMGRKDYNTVAEMQADLKLKYGDICHTLGFHTPGDGGAAWYKVKAHGVANGMDILDLENNCIAVLQITESYVTPEMFGAYGDGVHDDSNAIQSAINSENEYIFFGYEKIYLSNNLIPRNNKTIDLNHSTLFLNNNVELPMFYVIAQETGHNFKVCNGTIDCNMANNHNVNQSAGTFWITNWDGLEFSNIKVQHAFRNVINLWNCKNIIVQNIICIDCGMTNAGGYYSVGAAFEPSCENVFVNNFTVLNMIGYGIHFNETVNYVCDNCLFDTLTGIAITCTKSENGTISNIICDSVDLTNIEINSNKNIFLENVSANNARLTPLQFGDNGSGISNEEINVKNFVTKNTIPSKCATFNYLINSTFTNCIFDKPIGSTSALPMDNVVFNNCTFNMNIEAFLIGIRFKFNDCKFNNFIIDSNKIFVCLRDDNSREDIDNGSALELDLTNFADYLTGGTIKILSYFSNNYKQFTTKELPISISNWSVGNDIYKIDGIYPRDTTVSMDSVNKKLIITNSGGTKERIHYELKLFKY